MASFWTTASAASDSSSVWTSAVLFPVLPGYLTLLPTIFRCLALAVLIPVLLLSLIDVLGWTFFKLVLRPLGWARTIRFKDPEPSTLIAMQASSATALPRKARTLSNSGSPKPDPTSRSSSSSSSSSPVIRYSSSSPSTSPPRSRSSSHSPTTSAKLVMPPLRRTSSELSNASATSLRRHRAASIGVEGPLIAGEDLQSPGLSDDEGDLDDHTSGSDGESAAGNLRRRKHGRGRAGVPRGGPAFGFTGIEGDGRT